MLFVRFTNDIEKDIEVGTSILTSSNEVAEGLCAFGPFKSYVDAKKCVDFWQKFYPNEHEHYAILDATEVRFCKRGSLGTIIRDITVIESVTTKV